MDSVAESRDHPGAWLYFLTATAIIFGLWGRFHGLGKWPLAIDEYYTAQSVQNILRHGWPEYLCGGFYTRGIVFQYLAALNQSFGLSPELATRLIAAVSSVLGLPAVYLLGCRLKGRTLGLLAVAVLAASVWEIEMARFGRMYMPFQAIFVWYLVFFVKYAVDRSAGALWPMLALSLLGVLVWEGGALLAMTNLLPPFLRHSSGRLSRADWIYLAGTAVLAVPLYLIATTELRMLGTVPPLPPDYGLLDLAQATAPNFLRSSTPLWTTLGQKPLWIAMACLPLLLGLNAMRWIATFRMRWLVALGLTATLATAFLHQLLLTAAILVLLLLLNILNWRELLARTAWPFHVAVLSATLFWIAYGLLTSDWYHVPQSGWLHVGALLLYEFVKFPHLVVEVALPWTRAVPVLGLSLALLIGVALIRAVARGENQLLPERVLLVVLISLLLAVGISETPRHETRYVFFLYPLAVLIALATLARIIQAMAKSKYAAVGVSLVSVAGFAATEDFKPDHVWRIDQRDINFRIGMSAAEGSHYHPRSDIRGAADWLHQHIHSRDDLVINGFPGVDFYYPGFDFFYMDWSDSRFENWSCKRGAVARWPNLPLIYKIEDLEAQIRKGKSVHLVTDQWVLARLQTAMTRWQPQIEWRSSDSGIFIVKFTSTR